MRPSCARSSNGWAWPRMDGPLEKHAGRGPRRRAFRPRLRGRAAQFSPSAERIEDSSFTGALTLRMPCEIIRHEAIGREAYKGSKGIWTWGISITSASGHGVERYTDNPQAIERCIEIYLWLVQRKYLLEVVAAFGS